MIVAAAVSPQFQVDSRQNGAPARDSGIPVFVQLITFCFLDSKLNNERDADLG